MNSGRMQALEAAAEAASRVNAMLVAKGILKLPSITNKTKNPVIPSSSGDMLTAEIEINDAPFVARSMVFATVADINMHSKATVSTRGRFMSFNEKARKPNHRPLYLYIQALTKDALDLAIEKIHTTVEEHLKSVGSTITWSRADTTVYPSAVVDAMQPPPLMSINTVQVSTGHSYVQDKIFVGLEHAPAEFDLKQNLIGPADSYLNHIRIETGASITLRGKNSGYLEPTSGREAFEPLHLHITHPKPDGLQAAKALAVNLIQTTQQEFAQWQQQQTLEMINMQNQHSALGAQQALQHRLSSTVGLVSTGGLTLGIPQEAVVSTLGIPVPQASTQNAALQIGSINVGAVATSLSTVLPSSLATSLVTTMPSILTTSTGAQLQLVQGRVLHGTGGIVTSALPTLIQQATQLPPATSAATVSLLTESSQLVYASALQQPQSVVQASQMVTSAQPAPTTILSSQSQQPTQLSTQVVLPTHQPMASAAALQSTTPTMFYLVSQGSVLPNQNLKIQTSPATVQVQVHESQTLVQTAATTQHLQQQLNQQQQQLQQQQQQIQQQQQQISNNTSQVYTSNAFSGTSSLSSTIASDTSVTYPLYRRNANFDIGYVNQKRKFEETSEANDTYMMYGQPNRFQHMDVKHTSVGMQQRGDFTSFMKRFLKPQAQQAMSKPGNLNDVDQQMMPPPPCPVSQVTIGGLRSGELDRKRLKGALWNNASAYGSLDTEDESRPQICKNLKQFPNRFCGQMDIGFKKIVGACASMVTDSQASNYQGQYTGSQSQRHCQPTTFQNSQQQQQHQQHVPSTPGSASHFSRLGVFSRAMQNDQTEIPFWMARN